MLGHTRLASIAFYDFENSYRVYYQDSDSRIRESCYDESNGWYTRDDSIVASNARKGTPIAATSWASGKEIRVYYLTDDKTSKLAERKWSVNDSNGVGSWEAAGEGLKSMKPESQTQLAVISTTEADNGDVSIRLFYQSASLELRQASNDGEKVEWSDAALSSGGGTFKIPRGSSLAATATDTTRIFYQATNRGIEVLRESGRQWRLKKPGRIDVMDKTPIAAAPVLSGESDTAGQINLYFVARDRKFLPKLLDTDQDEWVDGYPSCAPTEVLHKGSALAAASPTEGETSIFFQSDEKTIAQYSEEQQAKLPLGIPRSRSGNGEVPCKRVDKANVSEFEEFGMLGLVRRQTIDRMDEDTRERLKQRLSYTVKQVISYSMNSNGFPGSNSRSVIEELSRDFRLGMGWNGDGSVWKNRNASQNWNLTSESNLQTKLEGAMGYVGVSNPHPINTYLYLETLYRLCRYLRVES